MGNKVAWLALPPKPLNRWRLFASGLQQLGYQVSIPSRNWNGYNEKDVLVVWNRTERDRLFLDTAEREGLSILVAEQPYIRHDETGNHYWALAVDGHNGSGWWPTSGGERWRRIGIEPRPWQESGDWILVCTQRGIGAPGMAMPRGWGNTVLEQLREVCDLHIEIRKPPKRQYGQEPLDDALKKAKCVVVWTSNVATQALLAGVPAILCGPHHICEPAMGNKLEQVNAPPMPDRLQAFARLADAQWTENEIESGEAFRRLLGDD